MVSEKLDALRSGVCVTVDQQRNRNVAIPLVEHAMERGHALLRHDRQQAHIRVRVETGCRDAGGAGGGHGRHRSVGAGGCGRKARTGRLDR